MKKLIVAAVLAYSVIGFSQTTPVACSALSVGTNGSLNGFIPSPNDAWHQDISTAPIAANSNTIVTSAADLGGVKLHPDFGGGEYGPSGIPYVVVDSQTTPLIPVPITLYGDESDLTPIPVPAVLPEESDVGDCPTDNNDRHAIIIDRNTCVGYEFYQANHCAGKWTASASALWDFTITESRPYGYTSADASGLSVFEGLIRYDEIVAGVINHAIRFTAQHIQNDSSHGLFNAPATHSAGNLFSSDNIMGMRIRLRADFDISGFSATNQIILKAMKKYGMILVDGGSTLYFQGTFDPRWNDDELSQLKNVPATAFDVIQFGSPLYNSATAPTSPAPNITSFTASSSSVTSGTSVTLTPTVTGATYSYIDSVGFIRGPVTVTPTATTTYTLTSRNIYGSSSASTTVTVTGAATTPTLTFAAVGTRTFGAGSFTVSASSESSGAITYSIASGPATILDNTVTPTGAGTIVVQASQVAAGSYSATTATINVTVNPGDPALAFVAIPNQTYGAAPFAVSTTTNSGGSIAYTVTSGPATISGNTVTLTGVGTVNLQASQVAAGNYVAATATTSFSVAGVVGQSVFIVNAGGSVAALYNSGAAKSAATAGGGAGLVVDASGNVLSIDTTGSSISKFTSADALATTYSGSGLSAAKALAIDGAGLIWVANGGTSNTLSALTPSGAAVSPGGAVFAKAANLVTPASVSVDQSGNVWIANSGNDTVTEVIGIASPAVAPAVTAVTNGTVGTRP